MSAMTARDAMPRKGKASVCARCGLASVAPIVVEGKCANAGACAKRVKIKKSAKRAATAAQQATP